MTYIQDNTPSRAQPTYAKIRCFLRTFGLSPVVKMMLFWRDPRQSLPRLTDRQARDIGIDPADLEWCRLQLPSRTIRHPML